MNDLTKEELETILDCIIFESWENPGEYEKLKDILIKMQLMIDNYCEHELEITG